MMKTKVKGQFIYTCKLQLYGIEEAAFTVSLLISIFKVLHKTEGYIFDPKWPLRTDHRTSNCLKRYQIWP